MNIEINQKIMNMKTYFKSLISCLAAVLMLITVSVTAQELKENSVKITLSGTSTIHEWDMLSTEGTFKGRIDKNRMRDIVFTVPVKSLVSGKSAMDRNTYAALNADKFENILFEAETIETLNGNAEVKGKMTINDVTKEITVPMTVTRDNGELGLQGFTQIQMTDYNVEPPKFMMGAVKTGEVVSVKFVVSVVELK